MADEFYMMVFDNAHNANKNQNSILEAELRKLNTLSEIKEQSFRKKKKTGQNNVGLEFVLRV